MKTLFSKSALSRNVAHPILCPYSLISILIREIREKIGGGYSFLLRELFKIRGLRQAINMIFFMGLNSKNNRVTGSRGFARL